MPASGRIPGKLNHESAKDEENFCGFAALPFQKFRNYIRFKWRWMAAKLARSNAQAINPLRRRCRHSGRKDCSRRFPLQVLNAP